MLVRDLAGASEMAPRVCLLASSALSDREFNDARVGNQTQCGDHPPSCSFSAPGRVEARRWGGR